MWTRGGAQNSAAERDKRDSGAFQVSNQGLSFRAIRIYANVHRIAVIEPKLAVE
jgi:hypothetical protein